MCVQLPQPVAIAAPPLAGRVVPLVLEPDGDPVLAESPEVLAQCVVQLALPLAGQELDDLLAAADEHVAVAPYGVARVGPGDTHGVTAVDRKSTRLHSSHKCASRMPSSA